MIKSMYVYGAYIQSAPVAEEAASGEAGPETNAEAARSDLPPSDSLLGTFFDAQLKSRCAVLVEARTHPLCAGVGEVITLIYGSSFISEACSCNRTCCLPSRRPWPPRCGRPQSPSSSLSCSAISKRASRKKTLLEPYLESSRCPYGAKSQ